MRICIRMMVCMLLLIACGEDGALPAATPIISGEAEPTVQSASTPVSPTAIAPATAELTPEPATAELPLFLSEPLQTGVMVEQVQARLAELGYLTGTDVTGSYDQLTEAAVRLFQTQHELDVDGVVGPVTWEALFDPAAQPFEAVGEPQTGLTGRILYLAPDGTTLRTTALTTVDDQPWATLPLDIDDQVTDVIGSPGGAYVAASFGEASNLYIYAADSTLLATYGGMNNLKWSPSGDRFMVQSSYEDASGLVSVIDIFATERADEQGPLLNTAALHGAWALDGTWVALVRDDGTLIKRDLATTEETFITVPGTDWFIQDIIVADPSDAVFIYAGNINELGATGNGMRWWWVPIIETAACQQNATDCGTPEPVTEPNGNFVDDVTYNPLFGTLAYAENVRSNVCSATEEVYLSPLITFEAPEETVAPRTVEVPENGGLFTNGLSWIDVLPILAYSYQPYECIDAGDFVTQMPQIMLWDFNTRDQPSFLVEGSFPVWLP